MTIIVGLLAIPPFVVPNVGGWATMRLICSTTVGFCGATVHLCAGPLGPTRSDTPHTNNSGVKQTVDL